MTLVRLKDIFCLAIPLMLAFASGDAAAASPAQSGQTVHVDGLDTPVQLPVVFPPVKKIPPPTPQPTEQELRTRAEAGDVAAMEAYAGVLSTPSDFPWFLKAAEGGSPEAMMIVANRARSGETGHGKDLALSDKWLNNAIQIGRQALSQKDIKVLALLLTGDSDGNGLLDAPTKAQYVLAIGKTGGFESEDISRVVINVFPHTPEKIQLLQQCSNGGHPWCTRQLAYDYLNGDDGLIIDHSLGIRLLTKVAQAGYNVGPVGIHGPAGIRAYPGSSLISQTERIQLWKTAIEHGALNYVTPLAEAYSNGDGVPKSAPISAALLQTLIQRPDIDGDLKGWGIWELACMYVDGKSFPVNEQLFLRVLNLASTSDKNSRETVAQFLLTSREGLLGNDALNISESTRVLLLKNAVENSPPFNDVNGNTSYYQYNSAIKLGDLYSSGQKVKQSYADAMTWYQKAEQIASGPAGHDLDYDGAAAVKVGILYEKGLGVPKDSSSAMSWYEKAVDNTINHSSASEALTSQKLMTLLNSVQLSKESVDRVITFIRSSAEADNDDAQSYLGKMYLEGKYVPQNYSEATAWLEKCSNHLVNRSDGWALDCTETIAQMYLQGQGVVRNPARAVHYYQRMADIGLGGDILLPMYCGGEGIPMDRPKAFALFKKGADQNGSFEELGVGAMYQMGWGVEQDLAEAFNWYRKAAANKDYGSAQAKADFTRIFRDCKGTPDNFNAAVSLYDKASGGQH